MRILILGCLGLLGVIVAGSLLGVAGAETSTSVTTPNTTTGQQTPTVSVQGVASETITQGSNVQSADAVYRQGMADAFSDGQSKAQFLAGKAGVTLGQIQNVTEDGGYIQCGEGEAYEGQQPDFGSGDQRPTVGFATPAASTVAPLVHRHKTKRPRRKPAKKASATSCTLYTQVSLVYSLS
jgi:hypothetical protein